MQGTGPQEVAEMAVRAFVRDIDQFQTRLVFNELRTSTMEQESILGSELLKAMRFLCANSY